MTFLTGCRLDARRGPPARTRRAVGAVAPQVGYSSPFALTTAFKRVTGVSPQQYRNRHRARAA